jgi:large subunit ribosomal protein L25
MARGQQVVIEVERREATGKNACRRLRREGKLPGNVYGLGRDSFMVAVAPRRVEDVLRLESGVNTIFTLRLLGEERSREAMIREIQRDPVSDVMIHVDFARVDMTRAIHVKVPIRLTGTPLGVKNEGGVLDFVHREVEVECLPGDIPEHIDVDVSELHINQNVHVSNLVIPEGVRVLDPAEAIVAVVVQPRAEEVEAAAAAPGAPAEGAEAATEKKEGEGESSEG